MIETWGGETVRQRPGLFTVTIETHGKVDLTIERQVNADTIEEALHQAIAYAHRYHKINADEIDEATVRRDL